ncbi:uncharacterized protein [Leptinotarsa decemlineata]|uniref:uncharacterized protein n=1 Tax=Leptinotarsa decemlineata TaxID=7539 RepID=UPI003D305786
MDANDIAVAAGDFLIIEALTEAKKNKKRKQRRMWARRFFLRRQNMVLLKDLDHMHMQNFTRMGAEDFENLICLVGPKIAKKDTTFRKAIPVQYRLAVTLRFLATGDSYSSLQYLFRISKQLIGVIIIETCEALIQELKDKIKMPSSSEEWLQISRQYEEKWQFPHCVGSMDGKQAPFNSGSEFHNYKSNYKSNFL